MRRIRVGFVLHAMQVAGAEMLVAQTIHRLGPRIEPTVLCLDFIGPLGEQLQSEGVEVISLDRKPGRDWRLLGRMRDVLNRRRIEVLHAHQYSPFFYAALAKPLAYHRPKVIFTEHGRHYPDVVSPMRRAVNRLILSRLADAINACSHFSAEALCRVDGFPGSRIEVIPNGVDLSRYSSPSEPTTSTGLGGPHPPLTKGGKGGVRTAEETATRRSSTKQFFDLSPSRRYLIMVARFHPVKDHRMLLHAFAELSHTHADVDLLLAGDGPLRGELEQLCQKLKIADRVKFLGVRSDVPDLLHAADVFALTSLSEAASLTLLEAMASGLPVVVTDVGGNPEIVRDGQEGVLVPRGDATAAAAAFRKLFDHPELAARLGVAGRKRVFEHFRLEQTIDAYASLYEQLAR